MPFVCKSCHFAQVARPRTRTFSLLVNRISQPQRSRLLPQTQTHYALRRQVRAASSSVVEETEDIRGALPQQSESQGQNPAATLSSIRDSATTIITGDAVPSEQQILRIFGQARNFANLLVYGEGEGRQSRVEEADAETTARPSTSPQSDTSSALLDDLSEDASAQRSIKAKATSVLSVAFRSKSAEALCDLLYHLTRDPKVNITQRILREYTHIQCLLGKPEYLPEIFDHFAYKPLATQRGPNITYATRRPGRRSAAIPLRLATAALSTAINKRDMGLAIAITDTTVATPAHQLQRFLTQATPKLAALMVIPLTAWSVSSWAAGYQNTFEPDMARTMALAAATAYVGTFGTIGFIAVTTWSDHHDRVHWQVGKQLTKRWLQEDEREFLDRIAQAWGFEDKKRRGEEQGEEWEALRDTIGLRGMVLDKTEFLEGMA